MSSKRVRPPLGDLLKTPPVQNPSAVRADDAASVAVEQRAPVATVESTVALAVEPEATTQAPPKVVEPEPTVVAETVEPQVALSVQPVVQQAVEANDDSANAAQMLFGAPVHRRSVKKKSSQLSVMVNAELYRLVSGARVDIPGLTGQTILTEGIVMWLIYNGFIDQDKGQEILLAHKQI